MDIPNPCCYARPRAAITRLPAAQGGLCCASRDPNAGRSSTQVAACHPRIPNRGLMGCEPREPTATSETSTADVVIGSTTLQSAVIARHHHILAHLSH